ncbi:MAG: hypothetical protein A3D95_00040 [Betaproteobacteria bacterium RIFCSPHIGHO2_12_FULL_69_13]|nr:MAG: hypothetical protein A3D95_00040 [Betaproteobacteria bacterium RIFCSPHIGHO2_12_FULL_69_13]OGA66939.1 MAG: hypothetical protein A3G83_05220 [Betaproteobacteria bacterium RIFCSPLOWO2_12_FULL_68_20]
MALELHVPEIAGVIQLAVAPVFMLTAVGAILAALNMRLGRAVDRRRILEERLHSMTAEEARTAKEELDTIAQRIRLAYLAILCAVLAGLFTCLLIAAAFLGAFVKSDLSYVIGSMFVLAMLALIACLLSFLREIFLAVATPRHAPALPPRRA